MLSCETIQRTGRNLKTEEVETRRDTRLELECLHPSKHPQAVQDDDSKLASSSSSTLSMLISGLVFPGTFLCSETPPPLTAAPRQSPPPHAGSLYSTHRMSSTWRPTGRTIAGCGGSLWSTRAFPYGDPRKCPPVSMNVPCKAQAFFARASATVSKGKTAEGCSVAFLLAGKDQGPQVWGQLHRKIRRVGRTRRS